MFWCPICSSFIFLLMARLPLTSNLTATLCPAPTLVRSLRPFTLRVERSLFQHRGCRRVKFARCGLPVFAARFARQLPLDLPAILLAATDAVDRAAFEAAAIAAGLVLEAEDDAHRGIARLFRSKMRIERLGERARRDQRAAVDQIGRAHV